MSTAHVYSLVGPPGSGKTTQAARLVAALGETWGSPVLCASVPALLRGDRAVDARLTPGERTRVARVREAAHARADRGELMPAELDRVLLELASRVAESEPVVLDSVPRGREQARLLLTSGLPMGRLTVFHLRPPGDPLEFSMRRQLSRAAPTYEGRPTVRALTRMKRKADVYIEQSLPALREIARAGTSVAEIDAGAPIERVAQEIRDHLARDGALPGPRAVAATGTGPARGGDGPCV
ncbi:hypothetical protein [Streptomyces sp. NPDC055036]